LLLLGIEEAIQELNSITLDEIHNDNWIEDHAPRFSSFFERLSILVSRNVLPGNPPTSHQVSPAAIQPLQPDQLSLKPKRRPKSLELNNSSPKKTRMESPESELDVPRDTLLQTPDRQTAQKDPYYSGDSVETIAEDNTKIMISTFIQQIVARLGDNFRLISWSTTQECKLKICGYVSVSIIWFSQRGKYRLGSLSGALRR
jgi:hypothetical protein